MRRSFLVGVTFTLMVGLFAALALAADFNKQSMSDPVCKKYVHYINNFGATSGMAGEWRDIQKQCGEDWSACKHGWDAAQGKPDPKIVEYLKAWMEIAKWSQGGTQWMTKLSISGENGHYLALPALPLFKVPGAANLAANLVNTQEKQDQLLRKGLQYAVQAFWYLGAKDKLDLIISLFPNGKYQDHHRKFGMDVIPLWKPSAAQVEKVRALCVDKIFQSSEGGEKESAWACLRFMRRTGVKHAETLEFVVNYLGNQDAATEAARVLGHVNHVKAKAKLQAIVKKESYETTRTVNRKQQKYTAFNLNYGAVAAAVTLYGMGDPLGAKAVSHWLEISKTGEFTNRNGFEALVYELASASPAAAKKLRPQVRAALKTVQGLARKDSSLNELALRTALALVKAGDNAGLKAILTVLEGSDKDDIERVVEGLGGETNMYGYYRRDFFGVTVGAGALTKAEVAKIVTTIKSRMKFWTDAKVKGKAVDALLDLEAKVKAAE